MSVATGPMRRSLQMPKNLDFTKAHETLSLSVSGPFVDQSVEMDCGTYIAKTQGVDFSAANARLPSPLTRREIQVLKMVAQGATNKQISSDLNISEHTVKSHVVHIFNKLGVNDRTLASVWAASQGLL